MTRKRPARKNRRRCVRRHVYGRRQSDVWKSVGKLAGVVASATVATLGQAELIGEPMRHYVTIVAIASTGVAAYLLGPENLKLVYQKLRGLR